MGEWDAWEPAEEPKGGFAERVVAAAIAEKRAAEARGSRKKAFRVGVVVLALAGAAAGALAAFGPRGEVAHGEITAEARTEQWLGSRARAVLEPGARVAWSGGEIVQARGDVFYRVERGGPFRVHTPAGDVEVKGTCFRVSVRPGRDAEGLDMTRRDWAVGGIGVVVGAAAFVGVYEGKVAVSRAGGPPVSVAAGESATLTGAGAVHAGDLLAGERAFASSASVDESDFRGANRNLADSVRAYKERLTAVEGEKRTLEKQLREAQAKVAAAASASGDPKAATPPKNRWEITKDDWAELAKEGSVKYQVPCTRPDAWTPPADLLNQLGLPPDDASALKNAYAQSRNRIWSVLKPICTEAIGSADLAEKLGQNTCIHVVFNLAEETESRRHRGGDARGGGDSFGGGAHAWTERLHESRGEDVCDPYG